MSDSKGKGLEVSALLTVLGVIVLFSMAIFVTLLAPEHIDPSWKQASSSYQVQMYDVADPNVYISTSNPDGAGMQYVYHIKKGFSVLAFQESPLVRIVAPEELEKFITHLGDSTLKLSSHILLLRPPENSETFKAIEVSEALQMKLQSEAIQDPPPRYTILELYSPKLDEAFAVTETDGIIENWVDDNFSFVGLDSPLPYPAEEGVIYIKNPMEYKVSKVKHLDKTYWLYNENGEPIRDISGLKRGDSKFLSRQALIEMGEDIYRIEGCWYCHTEQTRTLVQDTVLNGSANYPAPPSSANEYIFQRVTFPGTRRIGPDLSRVGVKRPHRDWHMSHFWSPKTESKGSIMPAFKHFFSSDPSGSLHHRYGLPNYKFEAIFQYLMTKGTRITPPTQAWWLGKDPLQTIDIIEGKKL